jgi:C4-dicarboxylate-specific signal transduction histidine kinase
MLMRRKATARSIRPIRYGLEPSIQGDRVQLQQVTLNLTINALEAMSDVTGGARGVADQHSQS